MKLAIGAIVVVMAAALGTVGVAYYNDPTIFDSAPPSPCCGTLPAMSQESCCPFSGSFDDRGATTDGEKLSPTQAGTNAAESASRAKD
jgi:hypothetical protein